MKILIVGGYGTFGGRLVDLLRDRENLTLYVAGRNLSAAQNFCWPREGKAKLIPQRVDRANAMQTLQDLKPDLVVDASGPFQVYGAAPYALVQACIENGINYLDLADGTEFVRGISALDEQAKAKGVFALSGMSSFPVLTHAVYNHLAPELDEIDSIIAGIAPSPHAIVGLNVIQAISSYCGKPVKLKLDGEWTTRAGFFDSRVMTVHVPGTIPLPPTRFALCDVPDLTLFPEHNPKIKTVWTGAGPTPAILHRLLWIASWLVMKGLLPSLLPFSRVMNVVINTIRWGEHRGGFILQMAGRKNGKAKQVSWHLLAEGEAGQKIPSMAAAAIIHKLCEGETIPAGSRSGHNDVTLADYQYWFSRNAIMTGVREDTASPNPIYKSVLGEAFQRLDAPLQSFHAATETFNLKGEAKVTSPANPIAWAIRKLFSLPEQAAAIPVDVTITVNETGEHWHRRFGTHAMQSSQKPGQGGLITESFGPLDFALAVTEHQGELHLTMRSWKAFNIPMPKFLMPKGQFHEHGRNGRFNFSVDIKLPLVGRLVCYEGWLR